MNIVCLFLFVAENDSPGVRAAINHQNIPDGIHFSLLIWEVNHQVLDRLAGADFLIFDHVHKLKIVLHERLGYSLDPRWDRS